MKIINEKGKLFGIINVVDLLVLVAAIAVVAGVGYKLFAKQIKEVASPQVSLTMTVRVPVSYTHLTLPTICSV